MHKSIVEVRVEVDGVFVDFAQHLGSNFAEARFGVTLCSRWVAVHAAEVALSVYKRTTNGEVLRKAHQGFVHGTVAVGVVLTKYVTDDTGALTVGLVVEQVQFAHRVQNTSVHGFKSVADVGDGTGNVDRHCVGNEGLFHFLFHLDNVDVGFG